MNVHVARPSRPKQRRAAERLVHLAVLDYLRAALPGALVHHSAQGLDLPGEAAARAVAKAKHLGMVVGWPDLVLLWRGQFWAFEVKREGGGRVSEAQAAVGALIERNGGRWAVVRSVADAEECVREWRGAL